MDRKLHTKRGERLYRKRAATIEPVFWQLRQRGRGRFRRRGLKACNCEWRFEHAVHNLLKVRMSGQVVHQGEGNNRPGDISRTADPPGILLSPAR